MGYKLKPLQGESPTGYFGFAGKPLSEEDITNLRKQGVNFAPYDQGGDLMPDGKRLKHPRFRRDKKLRKESAFSDLKARMESLRGDYNALPEPRPDYFVWAFGQLEHEFVDTLYRIARAPASSGTERIKAISTMLEFAKSKPKQQLEVSGGEETVDYTARQLLELALEANGIDTNKFLAFIESNPEAVGSYQDKR